MVDLYTFAVASAHIKSNLRLAGKAPKAWKQVNAWAGGEPFVNCLNYRSKV